MTTMNTNRDIVATMFPQRSAATHAKIAAALDHLDATCYVALNGMALCGNEDQLFISYGDDEWMPADEWAGTILNSVVID